MTTSIGDTTQAAPSLLALVDDSIHAVGGSISLKHTPMFVAEGTKGWLPFQCYVVRDGAECLIIDTGLPKLANEVRAGLDIVVGRDQPCGVFATRREVENLDNLSWVLRRYDVQKFYFLIGHMIAPLDVVTFWDEADTAHEVSVTEAHIAANEYIPIEWIQKPEPLKVGARTLTPIRSPVAILSTYWLYDETSGTLFSSDMWAFVPNDGPGGPVVAAHPEAITVEQIQGHLEAKFDLLCGTDTTRVKERLRAIAKDRRVQRICPSYGCIIEGADAVADLIDKTIVAVERVGQRPRKSVLGNFRNSKYLTAAS